MSTPENVLDQALAPDAQPPAELPTLVIVGRPNVGKSTLFNRITKSRRAIVGDEPGITRDRIRLEAEWKGRRFLVTDTGGMTFGDEDEFPTLINEQVRVALETADQIVFVVDGRAELTSTDRQLSDFLRRIERPVTVAVNKCDTPRQDETAAAAFYELGFERVVPISAEHDRNVPQLLEVVAAGFPVAKAPAETADRHIRVAIIGRPNTGKSTLLNRLIGEDRSIVSPTAGTTRDAVDATVERGQVKFTFVDTAGIRRKGKTTEMTEKLSVVMAQRHLRLADVALMMIDASEGVTQLDANIAGYAHEAGKGLILVVNKWDLLSGVEQAEFRRDVRDKLRYLEYAPIAIISALNGSKTESLYPLVRKTFREARKRVPTSELNRFVETVDFERATFAGGKRYRIAYVTQPRIAPPTFIFFTNRPEPFHFGFERFLINQLRERFGFEGTPILVRNKMKRR